MSGATLRNKPPAGGRKKAGGNRNIPQREKIIKAVQDAKVTFWRDEDGEAYASVPQDKHVERYRVQSSAFRNVVRGLYSHAFTKKGGTPVAMSDAAWHEARGSFEAMAFRGEVRSPEVRLCQDADGTI